MQAGNGGGTSSAAAIYRGFRSRQGASALGEINVTPLVDVVLVLLLVFMVTAPMMSRGIDVSLPSADQPDIHPEDRVTVSIDAREQLFIGERRYTLEQLAEDLRDRMAASSTKVVYLRADETLRYGRVIAVVDRMKRAGVDQIGFVYVLPREKR